MNRTKSKLGIAKPISALLLVLALTCGLRAQEPTACIGADIDELRAALKANPQNIGLRMRIVRKQLDEFLKTDNQRKSGELMQEVESQLDAIKELGPEFSYVYRVLARQYFRRAQKDEGEYTSVLEVLNDHKKVAELDFEMRSMYVRALLLIGWDDEAPKPERVTEAVNYVANWFDSPKAPDWGATLAFLGTWLLDSQFRDELLAIYEARYEKAPNNLNLALSLAGCYYTLGRYESGWRIVHEAERRGLCDDVTGGRHPVVEMLRLKCVEVDRPELSYDGFDLARLRELSQSQADNLSLTYRLGIRLRAKGFTGESILRRIEERVEARLKEDPKFDFSKLEEQKKTIREGIQEAYVEAVPLIETVLAKNPQLDSALLLLGDLHVKLENLDAAVTRLEEGIARVPFFFQLREKLAEVEAERENWDAVAKQLAEVCKVASCDAAGWNREAPGSILPVPRYAREQLMVEMIKMPAARESLIKVFSAAAAAEPRNPNLKSYMAMIHYFAGNKAEATRWMREAEALGLCGEVGLEHLLAFDIYSRKDWN